MLVPITEAMTAESTSVSIGNTAPFSKFAGITATTGQALIENEIVQYTVGTDVLSLVRGVGDTVAVPHPVGTNIQTYEAAGMPLVGINTVITVPANATIRSESDIDFYYLAPPRGTPSYASYEKNIHKTSVICQMILIYQKKK